MSDVPPDMLDTIICGDCLEVMRRLPDGCCVVVTDPPYGIGEARRRRAIHGSRTKAAPETDYGVSGWDDDPPPPVAFAEMRRVGREQVIFGGNHLATWLGSSPGWIVWDKNNEHSPFADCELAWTSYKRAVRKVKWRWNGMLQEPGHPKEARCHPTQKPVGLMLWVLENYTEPTDLIIDPFCGSGTTCVAAKRLGRHYIGIEIDEGYCEKARGRLRDTEKPLFGGAV
jgi:DNA modification methylase